MKKEFIIDDNKVRKCDSNISKMNIAEYIYYSIFHWNFFGNLLINYIGENLIESIKYFGAFLINTIILILTPVMLPISAYKSIKNAKVICEKSNSKGTKIDKEDFKNKLKPRA